MNRPIVLIGYRATGKTTLARILAEQLQCFCFDSDLLIEKRAGKSIRRIFAEEGETIFRDWEAEEITKIFSERTLPHSPWQTFVDSNMIPFVLATGGGAILRESTRNLLRQNGKVVWLTASEQTIFQRMSQDASTQTSRPHLTAFSALEEITHLLNIRNPLYEQTAHLRLNTEETSLELLCERILTEKQP